MTFQSAETITAPTEPKEQLEIGTETDAPNQESINTQPDQEILDWTQDKRAKTMWKNDPNQLYGSYKNMEKLYTPIKTQHDKLMQTLKEHGVEAEKVTDVLKEYQGYKDPSAPQNQWLNYFGKHLNADHKDEVIKFFNDLDKRIDQKKYGENLPDDVIAKLKKVDDLEKNLQEREQKEQHEQELNKTVAIIEKKLTEIESMAKEYDVVFDQQVKDDFVRYCKDNDISPQYMDSVFSKLAIKAIKTSSASKASNATIQNIQSNKKAGISSRVSGNVAKGNKTSYIDDIKSILNFT